MTCGTSKTNFTSAIVVVLGKVVEISSSTACPGFTTAWIWGPLILHAEGKGSPKEPVHLEIYRQALKVCLRINLRFSFWYDGQKGALPSILTVLLVAVTNCAGEVDGGVVGGVVSLLPTDQN